MNTNHDNIANRVKAITHKSVLLSINIKNAHIPLVNHNNNIAHPVPNVIPFVIFDSFNFSEKYSITS